MEICGNGGELTDISSNQKFEKIMELYGSMMHRVAVKILKNDVDAEEVVQETLLKLFKNKTVPDLIDEFIAAKLTVAVKNMALDFYIKIMKRRAIQYEDSIDPNSLYFSCPSEAGSIINSIAIQQCIERLPVLQKEYILLRFHQELSVKEIAILKGKSEKSVYSTLEKAIAKLRIMINE